MPAYEDFMWQKFFRLEPGGVSYDAAAKLDAILESRTVPDATPKAFGKAQRELLECTNPELLQPLGLMAPAIYIEAAPAVRPRAYERYAQLVADKATHDYYVFSWIDYKGSAFQPPDSTECSFEESDKLYSRLFSRDEEDGRYVLHHPKMGIEIPEDFSLSKHFWFFDGDPTITSTIFFAEGRSLDMVDDYKSRLELFLHNGGTPFDRNRPSLKDYPELIGDFVGLERLEANPDANVPHTHSFAGRTLLVYLTDVGNNNDFAPPDGVRFPTEAFDWLASDQQDRKSGDVSPPTPPALEKYIKGGMGSGTIVTPEPPRRMMPRPPL